MRQFSAGPSQGLVLPGERVNISLTVLSDDSIVGRLNCGTSRLDDTIILHTLLGKDHFVSITAQYGMFPALHRFLVRCRFGNR